MPRIQFATQAYKSKSLPVSAQQLINLYAEKEPPDAKTDVAVFGVPGLINFATIGQGPIRNGRVMDGVLYIVSGPDLYSVDTLGNGTFLGTGISGSNYVSMADNGNQVCIVNGVEGFVYTVNGFASVGSVTFQNGGENYVIGDTITGEGGTASTDFVLTVSSIGGGGSVTGVDISTPGSYQTLPANPVGQSATSGSGSGIALDITWSGAPSGFQKITSAAFNPANTVIFFDGYFLFDWAGTAKFFYSALYDGTTYNALDYYTAEVQPDGVLALCNQQENLLIFCETNIETWYDTGTVNDPFQRYDGATIERGCAAALSIVKEDNSVFFLGNDKVFYRLDGIVPRRISTHAIEQEWQTYAIISDAFSFNYTFEGHKFITIVFPSANATWTYDVASGLWHQRESFEDSGASLGRWRGNCAISYANQVLIGDLITNQVGQLSSTAYTEYGAQLQGIAVTPPIHSDRKRVFHNTLELDMEVGVGLTSGQASNPQVLLSWSDDGGRTYSRIQQWRTLGAIGAYRTRLRWTRLGNARQRVYRVTVSDPVRRTFIAAHLDSAVGDM